MVLVFLPLFGNIIYCDRAKIVKRSKLKKLLILSYYFPPLGLGGTQRAAKFAKYLPEFGWSPTVLTVKPVAYWARDESLLNDLEGLHVIRTESSDPLRLLKKFKDTKKSQTGNFNLSPNSGLLQKLNQNVFSFFLVPDSKLLWNGHVLKTVERLLKQEHYDALFTTSPPHSTHLAGKKIARSFGLKWVADFRDDWAAGHVVYEPTPVQKWLNRRMQKSVIETANAVICASNGIKSGFEKDTNSSEKFTVITNGFDAGDFTVPTATGNTGNFVFCYCGVISKFSDPAALFQGLKIFREKNPATFGKVKFQFVGYDATGKLPEMVKSFGLENTIELTGFKPHEEAVQYLVNADFLLLLATGKKTDTFIPGKTFEYFAAQKPVFCLSNVPDTNEILAQYGLAKVMGPDNPEKIAANLDFFIGNKWSIQEKDKIFIQQFNRKNQTKHLAEILDRL